MANLLKLFFKMVIIAQLFSCVESEEKGAPSVVPTIKKLTSSYASTCILTNRGEIYCMGLNERGSFGVGHKEQVLEFQKFQSHSYFIDMISVEPFTCGLTISGDIECAGDIWPYNFEQMLPEEELIPIQVTEGHIFKKIYGTSEHICAIDDQSKLWCFGYQMNSYLGNGTTGESSTPVEIGSGRKYKDVAMIYLNTCAQRTTGDIECWGRNIDGADILSPTYLPDQAAYKKLSATSDGTHYCGLTTNNKAECWGPNWAGQLGDGTTIESYVPVSVLGADEFKAISAGDSISCGIDSEDYLKCWGEIPLIGEVSVPVTLTHEIQFKHVEANFLNICAISLNDDLYCWGKNELNQMGKYAELEQHNPVKIPLPY